MAPAARSFLDPPRFEPTWPEVSEAAARTAPPSHLSPKAVETYDTYGHMFPERDAEITERLGDFFRQGVDLL